MNAVANVINTAYLQSLAGPLGKAHINTAQIRTHRKMWPTEVGHTQDAVLRVGARFVLHSALRVSAALLKSVHDVQDLLIVQCLADNL